MSRRCGRASPARRSSSTARRAGRRTRRRTAAPGISRRPASSPSRRPAIGCITTGSTPSSTPSTISSGRRAHESRRRRRQGIGDPGRAQAQAQAERVLVRVRAVGLNRAELAIAAGHKHGNQGGPGAIPGLEWSGEVAEIGAEVRGIKPGDRVMCSGGGGYAEYAVCDWGRVSPIPANNMTYPQAATLPVALQTMHNALITNGRLKAGESVLIQGASSGVGLMGLQIAKLKGARL